MSDDEETPMSHVPAPESPTAAFQPESGPVSDRDAQDAREARFAEAMWGIAKSHRDVVANVIEVADSELAPLAARVAELEALVGDEDQPGWDGCSRAEAIRQANEFHAGRLRWIDEHDKRRAERDEARTRVAALARVEALADEWEGWAANRSTMRIDAFRDAAESLRAALAAAGPAVSACESCGAEGFRLRTHPEEGLSVCDGCYEALTAVSDGEGATSEAWEVHVTGPDDVLPAPSKLEAMMAAQQINAEAVRVVGLGTSPYLPMVWATPRPASPVVAPSVTDEGDPLACVGCGVAEADCPGLPESACCCRTCAHYTRDLLAKFDDLTAADAVPPGEASDEGGGERG